jgi:hypothetical protein
VERAKLYNKKRSRIYYISNEFFDSSLCRIVGNFITNTGSRDLSNKIE